MGWTEEVALATDINYVIAAYEGRIAMFQRLFGSKKEEEPEPEPRKITAHEMLSFARTHNALVKTGKIKLQKSNGPKGKVE